MTKIFVDLSSISDKIIIERLTYTLDFIQHHPITPKDTIWSIINSAEADVIIHYGKAQGVFSFPFLDFCFTKFNNNLPKQMSYTWKDDIKVYGLTQEDISKEFSCQIDIFQTIFFHISRFEEWHKTNNKSDQHGLMPSEEHFLVKNGIQDIPVVDHLVYYLNEIIGLNPHKIETNYRLTHDVDIIRKFPNFYKFTRSIANVLLFQEQKWDKLKKLLQCYYDLLLGKTKDPYDTFEWLLCTDNPKITDRKIYFLSGGKTKYENYFNPNDPECKPIFELSQKYGYQFGIHPSYLSGCNEKMIKDEKELLEGIIGQKAMHSRQHFLKYNINKTGKILEKLEISTDSSFGYRDRTGFRCGTGFPYKMYNFEEEKSYSFLEIPLVVMDMAIIHQVGWDSDAFKSHLEIFLSKNKYLTLITFNFHNSTFDPILLDDKKLKSIYQDIFIVKSN